MIRRALDSNWLSAGLRIGFFLALVAVGILALMPVPPPLPGAESDKIQHFAAFFVLAVLGASAFRRHTCLLVFGIMAFGAMLELLQGTALIARDMSAYDWLADVAGTAIGAFSAAVLFRASPLPSI